MARIYHQLVPRINDWQPQWDQETRGGRRQAWSTSPARDFSSRSLGRKAFCTISLQSGRQLKSARRGNKLCKPARSAAEHRDG